MGSKAIKMKDISGNAVYPCPYYPVGSIYMSVNNVNPSEFFGGTWEQIKDRFLLACGTTYSNGVTGGEATHKLTVNEMPSHNHGIDTSINASSWNGSNNSLGRLNGGTVEYKAGAPWIYNTGGSQAHNNMPPYLAVYVWKRTA